jgi:hypothetical protein
LSSFSCLDCPVFIACLDCPFFIAPISFL